jgi:hypothetical protein
MNDYYLYSIPGLEYVGDNLAKFPENETVLQEMMRSEPSKRMRQSITESLTVHIEPGE